MAMIMACYLTSLYSKGVELFNEDFTATNLTTPEALEALQERIALFEAGSADLSVDSDAFVAGDVAMTIQASWQEGEYREVFGDAFERTVGIAPIPAGDDWRSLQYAFFYGVDANSDVPDEVVGADRVAQLARLRAVRGRPFVHGRDARRARRADGE